MDAGEKQVDVVIAGGGGAGLGLAFQLATHPRLHLSILIIDKDAKKQNDRTWCYWTDQDFIFNKLAYRTWEKIRFTAPGKDLVIPLEKYRYRLIRGIDFYDHIRSHLAGMPNVSFLQAQVERIEDGEGMARVTAAGQVTKARWVFDSLFDPQDLALNNPRYHFLMQHFKGWEIETEQDVFDAQCLTLFDFNTPQGQQVRFFYILPYSPRQAVVEYTLFSAQLLPQAEYESHLRAYLAGTLGLDRYRILSEENGIIPMTDRHFTRQAGRHVVRIGTKGGLVKPSTGYAFLRMQEDAAAIASSLAEVGHPFGFRRSPRRYSFYDSIFLNIMARHGAQMQGVFTQLFTRNPIHRIFRFLDEKASLSEDIRVMVSLPLLPFTRALIDQQRLRWSPAGRDGGVR